MAACAHHNKAHPDAAPAKGWRPTDPLPLPLPLPAAAAAAAEEGSAAGKVAGRWPGEDAGQSRQEQALARARSPIPGLARQKRKGVMHQAPAWLKAGKPTARAEIAQLVPVVFRGAGGGDEAGERRTEAGGGGDAGVWDSGPGGGGGEERSSPRQGGGEEGGEEGWGESQGLRQLVKEGGVAVCESEVQLLASLRSLAAAATGSTSPARESNVVIPRLRTRK